MQIEEGGGPDGSLSWADHPTKSREIPLGAVSHPGGDTPTQDALYSAGVEVPEHTGWEFKVPQSSEVEEALLGFLH